MSMLARIAAVGSGAAANAYVDDVFSTYTYSGTSATQTITNGIDLAGKGGLVWIKARNSATYWNVLFDTVRGGAQLSSNNTDASLSSGSNAAGYVSYNSSGFTTQSGSSGFGSVGLSGNDYVSWTFRKAAKFFDVQSVTKSAGSNATVSFSDLATLGMVAVRRTDSTGSWYVWHRSATAGKLLYLEQTAAEATLGHITVSDTTVTLVNGTIADGSYVVYAWAHDTATDGNIQCGSFTTGGSGDATVSLGWEPQFAILKGLSTTGDWFILDRFRSWVATASKDASLSANTSAAEVTTANYGAPTATGFAISGLTASKTYIYLAIRRPNKPPTTGTQVYNAIARTGTGAVATVTGVGFAPDVLISHTRGWGGMPPSVFDRYRGSKVFLTDSSSGESSDSTGVAAFTQDGVNLGADSIYLTVNYSGQQYAHWFFRRAAGVHDQICFSGTGANKTETHTLLGVAPELWLVKSRSGSTQWVWGSSLLANTEKIVMPSPAGVVTDATAWNSTYPTSTALSLGTADAVNTSAVTYTAYLWATLSGVSKVGGYTGNGSNQTVNCGFTTGARFVMIIRTTASTSQDIFIWDTVRGIVSGNDPRLSLNTTAGEATTDDSIDPDSSGFIVNELDATHINVNGTVYIFLAYA